MRAGDTVVDGRMQGDEIVITVRDTGEGIPEDLLPQIFDKFVAGDSLGHGRKGYDSGLGLTFCKLAVQSHGGRIWIASRPGEGTSVFVALPLEAAARVPQAQGPAGSLPGASAA